MDGALRGGRYRGRSKKETEGEGGRINIKKEGYRRRGSGRELEKRRETGREKE